MKFIADLHVHSKFSIATAKTLDLEHLYIAAQLKGISVVATGDFTHPGWWDEIRTKLVPDGSGLFALKPEIAKACDSQIPAACLGQIRFMLVSEISNIYKKDGATRKNHNLVFVPDVDSACEFSRKLDQIGNITSDGRPILGLDARDMLEMLLTVNDSTFLIPAHIWTPWFSMLGSKSGFDSLEECFEDLSSHIFSVETGLSSDPAMNWRIPELDGITLISNSDAHSPSKLGREANLFNTELSYQGIRTALSSGNPRSFLGTYEFYPEEGKYHLDGHRKCGVRLWPSETRAVDGICPECGKPLTLGVLYRVEELARRKEKFQPVHAQPFYSTIALTQILSELLNVGSQSKTVQRHYQDCLAKLGPEFAILHSLSPDHIDQVSIPLLGEAIQRMRRKEVTVSPGYDGEFGVVQIFAADEREKLMGQQSLFSAKSSDTRQNNRNATTVKMTAAVRTGPAPSPVQTKPLVGDMREHGTVRIGQERILNQLNQQQQQAVIHQGRRLLMMAGPGTGKTRTLTHRIAYLIHTEKVAPEQILALTFTHQAAKEMGSRLQDLLGSEAQLPWVMTFHALGMKILNTYDDAFDHHVIDDTMRHQLLGEALRQSRQNQPPGWTIRKADRCIRLAKQHLLRPGDNMHAVLTGEAADELQRIYARYQALLNLQGLCDFEDLILRPVQLLMCDHNLQRTLQDRFRYVLVDEYQDLNHGQYRFAQVLVGKDTQLFVIGDPNQSIYGFRGASKGYFERFHRDYPNATQLVLNRNYRSAQTILDAAYQVIETQAGGVANARVYSGIDGHKTITILKAPTARSEAVAVGRCIESHIGGTGFFALDAGKVDGGDTLEGLGFADFAILFRIHRQSDIFAEVFDKAGIPYQVASRQRLIDHPTVARVLGLYRILEDHGIYPDLDHLAAIHPKGLDPQVWLKFREWGYQQGLDVNRALQQMERFPVEQLPPALRLELADLSERLKATRAALRGLTTENKLRYLLDVVRPNGTEHPSPADIAAEDILLEKARTAAGDPAALSTSVALTRDVDLYAERAEKVTLMTLHAAKGLEFAVVFVAGCEQDLIPLNRNTCSVGEEQRLFYVAMTRARRRLYLTWCQKRRLYGTIQQRTLSPFVRRIESVLTRQTTAAIKKEKQHNEMQLQLF